MLAHSTLSVAAIARYFGFSKAASFVKFFRRVVGVTPAMFGTERSCRTA
jgi:transcriptional regulator GlxA family with amidase domain